MEIKFDIESSNGVSGFFVDLKMKIMKSIVFMKSMEGVCIECT